MTPDPWTCEYCGFTAPVPVLVRDHIRKHHPEETR